MKRFILSIMAVMMMATVFAQSDNTEKKERKRMDPTEMVAKRTKEMTEKYGLSAEQSAKVKALNEKYMGKRRGGKNGQRPKMKEGERPQSPKAGGRQGRPHGPRPDMTQYNNELKTIMTEKQYKAYTEDQNKRKEERKNRQKKD